LSRVGGAAGRGEKGAASDLAVVDRKQALTADQKKNCDLGLAGKTALNPGRDRVGRGGPWAHLLWVSLEERDHPPGERVVAEGPGPLTTVKNNKGTRASRLLPRKEGAENGPTADYQARAAAAQGSRKRVKKRSSAIARSSGGRVRVHRTGRRHHRFQSRGAFDLGTQGLSNLNRTSKSKRPNHFKCEKNKGASSVGGGLGVKSGFSSAQKKSSAVWTVGSG